ncbi:LacI family DNA-binding transcriptional regulator [Microbacterium sulfonylureivorans]|uniref:LacI family DNA-binding transcriptional regulator n=1 Tax=Microbacterium sulfonylureivorans TaxID=2486854 RepID=UPI0013DF8F49|nr:LacI family DNA-binding transcriptional regulator [Microbacterium sulfonylureivorans]
MVGIAEVAARAEVTKSVVSRVLNGDPTVVVRAETRERIIRVAKELAYTPNYAARALKRSRVGAIGLAVHGVTHPLYSEIISGAQRIASERHMVLILADNIPELANDSGSFDRIVRSGLIDGILIVPAGTEADTRLADSVSKSIPLVIVNDAGGAHSSVSLDNAIAAGIATRHLIDLGHTRIGMFGIGERNVRAQDREDGFRRALTAANIPVRDEWMLSGGTIAATGKAAAQRMFQLDELPSGVVVGNSMAATGVLAAAREAGVRVPEELSVIGFNDLPYADQLNPPLTVVATPLEELGAQGMSLLLRQLDTGTVENLIVTEPEPRLVIRGSTAPPHRSRLDPRSHHGTW